MRNVAFRAGPIADVAPHSSPPPRARRSFALQRDGSLLARRGVVSATCAPRSVATRLHLSCPQYCVSIHARSSSSLLPAWRWRRSASPASSIISNSPHSHSRTRHPRCKLYSSLGNVCLFATTTITLLASSLLHYCIEMLSPRCPAIAIPQWRWRLDIPHPTG